MLDNALTVRLHSRPTMSNKKTALQRIREHLGFSSRRVAEHLKLDISGLHRIETGENIPTRPTAQKIWKFYAGLVPMGVIYDPCHKSSQAWFSTEGRSSAEIATFGARLVAKHPKLLVRVASRK